MEKKKRNLIDEIQSIKKRTAYRSVDDFYIRLSGIRNVLIELKKADNKLKNELLRYIPISTIACFEGYFRYAVKEIIDFGEQYHENIKKLGQTVNVKLDFEILASINTKTFTIGEFIAHVIPCNNLDGVNSILSNLLDISFIDEIKKFKGKKSMFSFSSDQALKFQNKSDEIINSIERMFDLRHILCHEFASTLIIDEDIITNDFENFSLFINHSYDFIWEKLSILLLGRPPMKCFLTPQKI